MAVVLGSRAARRGAMRRRASPGTVAQRCAAHFGGGRCGVLFSDGPSSQPPDGWGPWPRWELSRRRSPGGRGPATARQSMASLPFLCPLRAALPAAMVRKRGTEPVAPTRSCEPCGLTRWVPDPVPAAGGRLAGLPDQSRTESAVFGSSESFGPLPLRPCGLSRRVTLRLRHVCEQLGARGVSSL